MDRNKKIFLLFILFIFFILFTYFYGISYAQDSDKNHELLMEFFRNPHHKIDFGEHKELESKVKASLEPDPDKK
jgi:hypothetical protein